MNIIGLEMDFDIITFLVIYGLVGVFFSQLLKKYKTLGLNPNTVPMKIITSLFFTWILMASIIMYQTDVASDKLKSISVDDLAQFYDTRDVQTIPQSKRRTWIGVRYKEIGIVSENRMGSINAVGWKGNSVFAYYDFDEKRYSASYHK